MTFSYASPPCYGRSYDNASPTCTSCSINAACRQEIMKVAYQPQFQAAVPQSMVSPPAPYQAPVAQPYQAPVYRPPSYQQMPYQPPPPPAQPYRIPVQTAPQASIPQQQAAQQLVAQAVQQVMTGFPHSPIGVYGAIPDPAISMLSAIPPIFRPQMSGETFWERVLKNLGARLVEVFLDEAKIAVRQAIFAPPISKAPASQATVHVAPHG